MPNRLKRKDGTMVNATYTTVTIVAENCGTCGIVFGLTKEFRDARRADGVSFFCPTGNRISYANTPQEQLERARQQLARNREALAAERADHRHTSNRLAGTQGALTRTKRRANAGTCLDCHRTFANVVRHRERMHPAT